MKVLVIGDMEGVAGVVKRDQVIAGEKLYEEARGLYTEEMNAGVRGACAAGATEVVVMDCHGAGGDWSFNSLRPELLDPRCEYVVQQMWTEYTDLLREGCDAALLIGMHAKAGTPDGVLCHTVSGQAWRDVRFNGVSVGETGINAAFCGQWGCPVVLVTGDQAVCREAHGLLGKDLVTVEVKKGLSTFSARTVTPARARDLIESGAQQALENLQSARPFDPGRPCEIEVEFHRVDRLEEYRHRKGVKQLDALTLLTSGDDWWTAWSQFFF